MDKIHPENSIQFSEVDRKEEVHEWPQELKLWRARPEIGVINYENQTISQKGWSTYRVESALGPIHIKGSREGVVDALLLPKQTQDLYLFENPDGTYIYLAVPNLPEGNYFTLPEGWDATDYCGIIRHKKEEEKVEIPELHPIPADDLARWASSDPFDDAVVITFNQVGKANFIHPKEKRVTFREFGKLPTAYVIRKEVVEKLPRKEVSGEAIGLTSDSLIEVIKTAGLWRFPSAFSDFYFPLNNPKIKDDRVLVSFGEAEIYTDHPRLTIRIDFSFSEFIHRCREVATNCPTGVIPEELKEKLIGWNNLSPPSRKDATYLFIDEEKLWDEAFQEKYRNILSDKLEVDPVRELVRIYEPTSAERTRIKAMQQEFDSEYQRKMAEYQTKVLGLESRGYDVLWIGNTPLPEK